jgi:hypothetical protein
MRTSLLLKDGTRQQGHEGDRDEAPSDANRSFHHAKPSALPFGIRFAPASKGGSQQSLS